MISRALFADAAKVANGEVRKAGSLVEYERRIEAGDLVDGDNCQVGSIRELQRLYDELAKSAEACWLDRYAASEKAGRPSNWRKKRIHFHDFMLDVHSRSQKHKGVPDPLEVVAGEISDESILLCLDEFMVTDVADALILNRLFGHLFSNGVILVATSNRAPDNLYEGGLQRDLFLPIISTLKERCVVHGIGSSTDYQKMTSAAQGFYFVGKELTGLLKQKFQHLVGEHTAHPQQVEVVMGRTLQRGFIRWLWMVYPFSDSTIGQQHISLSF
ncbi:AFG1-like ATPase [Camellia lanceoleosa]|uniref:AFG1-like ATPase n=1 Tax=Camellia lanceoleosa TaxID=1840588 RepID=A0ACC0I0H2_9ERIC|nr:AFG1-like ATPase [Camellia lanceoleosa]